MTADTRQSILQRLLHHREHGLTIDELAERLAITRGAVQQHVVGLERAGLVEPVGQRSTGGRPSRAYGLTEKGLESFPRRYLLLAEGLIAAAQESLGEEALEALLLQMADKLSGELQGRVSGRSAEERLEGLLGIMNELGYDASLLEDAAGITAVNCVYHKLARRTRAVCHFDVRLLSGLLGADIDHSSCMADGEGACVFRLRAAVPDDGPA